VCGAVSGAPDAVGQAVVSDEEGLVEARALEGVVAGLGGTEFRRVVFYELHDTLFLHGNETASSRDEKRPVSCSVSVLWSSRTRRVSIELKQAEGNTSSWAVRRSIGVGVNLWLGEKSQVGRRP
jgi:hypothetical protein